ncbi:MAG: 16S rRNA (uracil(1498)-N(3))-methyltransferase [Marinilabiliales bacterium]|nr:16S rRNA (uracil(1498)-N(3))-methyltransferase [Marinilabiliales bacterium]
MNAFYLPVISDVFVTLEREESKHCIRVLRLKKGDTVHLLDGKGRSFLAVITDPDPNHCLLQIEQETKGEVPRPFKLTIGIAPTKNMDRFEWFLEKATEIGIDRIVPLLCRHSERKEIKSDRLEKILVSAMKQSGQLFLPQLDRMTPIQELFKWESSGQRFIAHCGEEEKHSLKELLIPGTDQLILIGPEGDFGEEEIRLALQNGFTAVSLGDSRLRTETAGLVACMTANLVNQ